MIIVLIIALLLFPIFSLAFGVGRVVMPVIIAGCAFWYFTGVDPFVPTLHFLAVAISAVTGNPITTAAAP